MKIAFLIIFIAILILQTILDFYVCALIRKDFQDFYVKHGKPGPLDRSLDRVMHKFRLSHYHKNCEKSRKIILIINIILTLKLLVVLWIAAGLILL